MGSKAGRRAARVAAAQARDCEWIRRGMSDVRTLETLRASDERTLKAALLRASHDAARPSHPNHVKALVVLGGLQTLAQERMTPSE